MTRATSSCLALVLMALPYPAPGRAQDFAPPLPVGPQGGAGALIERGLPAPGDSVGLEGAVTRWLGLRELETRSVALALPWRSVRAALGLAQTGDPELGWTAAALGVGACAGEGGMALRACARHDRAAGAVRDGRLADTGGLECGAGAWLAAAPGLLVWASAPQLATAGEPPPLVRPLEVGGRLSGAGLSASLALVAPRAGDDGERIVALAFASGPLQLWGEARDGPWRGAFGVRASAGAVMVAAAVEAHPVLCETTRLLVVLRPPAARGPR